MKREEQVMKDNKAQGAGPRMHGPGMHGRGPAGKPKDFRKAWGRMMVYSKSFMPFIVMAVVFAMGGSICSLIGPDRLSDMTDAIQRGLISGVDMDAVWGIAISLGCLYGVSAILSYVQSYTMTTITQKLTRRLRGDIDVKINRVPLSYFTTNTYGDVLSRVTNDVDTIGQSMSQSIVSLFTAATMFLGSLIMMFYTNWVMALTAIFSSLFGFAIMSAVMGRSQKYFTAQQKQLGLINGHIEEIYTGHNVVKAYNGEKKAIKTFDQINESLYNSAWKSQFLSGLMMPIMGFIGNFGYVAVCVVGAMLVLQGHITFGVIVAFMLYVRLFTTPLSQIAQAMTSMQSMTAASERVFEFLDGPQMEDESHKTRELKNAQGDVEFRHVKFGYEPGKTIIHDFSAHARPGMKVAIVGPTGAGKTTMVNLLMRFYELDGGQILIDGIPLEELTRKNIHDLFGMVLQDTWLFEGTIRENIVYSKKDVPEDELRGACRAAGIDHFISTLPNGYDTVLNDKANLSAGQKQLITIARAMVENAPLLILDEATSSVDTRTEARIQEAMDILTRGRTSFIIAHRLSTIKNADLILVMKDGDVIESGNHVELMAKGGFYAELYNSQFEAA